MARPGVSPSSFLRRTPLYRRLEREGARFEEIAGGAVAMDYGCTQTEEIAQARRLGLADLSPLARIGFKGKDAVTWLRSQGIELGDDNNRAWTQYDDGVALRLADNEVLILGCLGTNDELCARLERGWSLDTTLCCYLVPRSESYAWLVVSGEYASCMFAKLCSVDLRVQRFANGSIAQTSVARLATIVIRHDLGNVPAFYLLFDSASADYLWGCLTDAMSEFGGRAVGLTALRALA